MATLEKFINALHKNARSLTAPLRAICPLSKICTRARISDLSRTQSSFYDRLLSALLEGSAGLEFSSGIDGQCSGQCTHEQAPPDALVTTRRAASASSKSGCDRWPAGFRRDQPCGMTPGFFPLPRQGRLVTSRQQGSSASGARRFAPVWTPWLRHPACQRRRLG